MNKINNNILVVDDEPKIRKLIRLVLEDENYNVTDCENGKQALRTILSGDYNLVILDLGLPDMDGKEVVDNIREVSEIPIIICSVRQDDSEVIEALKRGADDYLIKPFNPDILVARVESILRRKIIDDIGSLQLSNGDLAIDLGKYEVYKKGKLISLTPKEFDLLKYFMTNMDKMITHQHLLKDIWGNAHAEDIQYLRVYIKQLRDKIEDDPKCPSYISTEPGVGYKMKKL